MKRSTLIIAALAVAGVFGLTGCTNASTSTEPAATDGTSASAPAKGSIVYFDLDRVLSEYDMANDERSVFETKAKGIDDELTRRGNKLQSDINSFQEKYSKGLLTNSSAQVQGQKLDQQQADFQNYYNQKQQEVAEEQSVMMNKIGDAINNYLAKFQKENGYAMVIATSIQVLPFLATPVCAGDEALDVTNAVLEGLNAEYVANKNNN